MNRAMSVMALLLLAAGAAWGQSTPPPDQAEQVKQLLERVQLLEKRVLELENKQLAAPVNAVVAENTPAAPVAARPQPTTPPAQAHQADQHEEHTAVREQEAHFPSLQIRGFGDADFSATDEKGTTSGFNLGQLDLHLASPLSRKVSYFGEITLNAHPTDYTIEVERSFIRYDFNDYFKISFGRFHTPIGYWNATFHHGAWLQTTIARPEMVRVGGTFIPVHFVGFLAEGNIPSGGAGLSYSVGVGNGRGEVISRPGDAGDNNNNRAWVANIFSRPTGLYGLQLGASLYRDKITLPNGRDVREWISSAHIVWTKESPEILAEFANVHHRDVLTNLVANSDAFYVQAGYRLPWFEKTVKPYYRFEYIHTPPSEQLIGGLGVLGNQDLVESIVGLRYDITNYAAFKSEYRRADRNVLVTPLFNGIVNGLFLQTAFTF